MAPVELGAAGAVFAEEAAAGGCSPGLSVSVTVGAVTVGATEVTADAAVVGRGRLTAGLMPVDPTPTVRPTTLGTLAPTESSPPVVEEPCEEAATVGALVAAAAVVG